MEQNGNIVTESPAEEQDAPPAADTAHGGAGTALDRYGHPAHHSEAEEAAYWRGYHAALGAAAEAGSESPRVRRMRVDGFTGAKQAVFLESIAAGFTTTEAAAAAGVSLTTVYNFRNRRAGRAFNIAWEAADRRARRPLADHLRDRSVAGQTDTYRDRDGEIVATRHRHDNRLAMAMLTRLDKKAEAYKEDERLVTVIAEEFEELLDVIEAEGDAEDYIDSRRPPDTDYRGPEEREPKPDYGVLIGWLQRHRYDAVDPADIDIADLDPAERDGWSEDQWARAERSGLLARRQREEKGEAGDE